MPRACRIIESSGTEPEFTTGKACYRLFERRRKTCHAFRYYSLHLRRPIEGTWRRLPQKYGAFPIPRGRRRLNSHRTEPSFCWPDSEGIN